MYLYLADQFCAVPLSRSKPWARKYSTAFSRDYRNRRLGEFLKELSLTEGRNTGIPTIQRELSLNGSTAASFVTDEDRLSFLVRIPCHEGEEGISGFDDHANAKSDGVNDAIKLDNEIPDRENDGLNDGVNIIVDGVKNLSFISQRVYEAIRSNPDITYSELAKSLGVSESSITRASRELRKNGYIARQGSDKTGKWIVLK